MLRPSCPPPPETEEARGPPVSGLHGPADPLACRRWGPAHSHTPWTPCPLLPGSLDPDPGPRGLGGGDSSTRSAAQALPPPSWEHHPQAQAPELWPGGLEVTSWGPLSRWGQRAGRRSLPPATPSATCHPVCHPPLRPQQLCPAFTCVSPLHVHSGPVERVPQWVRTSLCPPAAPRAGTRVGRGPVLEPAPATDSRLTCQHAAPAHAEPGARRGGPTHPRALPPSTRPP